MKAINQPFWKRWLSHFMEWHIESAPSHINPHLYVSLKKGRYQLSAARAVYSFSDLYDNFGDAFQNIQLPQPGSKVLILGFGLGSIPILLEKTHQKKYFYTAVEIDENVLYLANKYTLPYLNASIELICTDAFAYVQQCKTQFDLVCVDIFLDDLTPDVFKTQDFLATLATLVAPHGKVLYNCLATTNKDLLATKSFFNNEFLKAFPSATRIKTDGNWLLFYQNKDLL
jgi:predicted membrane-bound spermidine synthase